jgi:hypothetical protein
MMLSVTDIKSVIGLLHRLIDTGKVTFLKVLEQDIIVNIFGEMEKESDMNTANILYLLVIGLIVALVIQFNSLDDLIKRDEVFEMRLEAVVKEVNDQGVLHGRSVKATADVLNNLNLGFRNNGQAIDALISNTEINRQEIASIKRRYTFNKN